MDLKIRPVHQSYNLKELLWDNFCNQKYVDTLIIASNGSIKAHSSIIRENAVFRDMLAVQKNIEEKVIKLFQFSLESITVILEYLYRGDARYFKEIEKEVKSAMKYFFELKPSVPVPVLTDSDETDLDEDYIHSPVINLRFGTNKSNQNSVDSIVLVQSDEISQSEPKVQKSEPRPENSQIVKIDNRKRSAKTKEVTFEGQSRFNPFASQEITAMHDSGTKTTRSSQIPRISKEPCEKLVTTISKGSGKETTSRPKATTSKEKSTRSALLIPRKKYIFESSEDEDDPTLNSSTKSHKKTVSQKQLQQSNKISENLSTKAIEDYLLTKPMTLDCNICVVCMKVVKNDIRVHENTKHNTPNKRLHKCEKCSHDFFYKSIYREHKKMCSGQHCNCQDCNYLC